MKKIGIAVIAGFLLAIITITAAFIYAQNESAVLSMGDKEMVADITQETINNFETEMPIEPIEEPIETETYPDEPFETESETQEEIFTEIGSILEGIAAGSGITSENSEKEENTKKDTSESENKESNSGSNNSIATSGKYLYYIKVNRQANCVTIYKKDADGNYTVPIKAMTCSVGLSGNTPLGVFKISDKYTWRLLFGNVYGQYAVRFNGSILFHSVPYTSRSKDTLEEGQFNLLGQRASKGCVRLSCADAKWIYDNCAKGTVVEVYDSSDPGPLGKPEMPKISENSPYKGWDPTDPDAANPWKKGSVVISGVQSVQTINQGEYLDLLAGVSAKDIDGLPLAVSVSETINTNLPGTYTITYTATGVLGTQASVTATVIVQQVISSEEETQTPETGDSQKPEIEDSEQPEAGESQKPETDDSEQPGTEDSQKPEIEDSEQLGTEDSQKPEAGESQELEIGDTQQSEIEETQATESKEIP